MSRSFSLIALGVLLLSGCGAGKYCLQDQEYQSAETVAPLKTVDGLQLPKSPAALVLPPPPANPVPFGVRDEHGGAVCLDQPPRLAPSPAKVQPKPAG